MSARSLSDLETVLLIAKTLVGSIYFFKAFYQSMALALTVLSMNFFLILPTP